MRRFLAIILLAVLPLQFSWAAVASYCEHENQAGAAHFGHHECKHHGASNVDAGTAVEKVSSSGDLDCSHCCGQCAGMPSLTNLMPDGLPTGHPDLTLDETAAAQASARPERPQWARLA